MKFLLDTNIISEIRKPRPHGGVLAWFTAHQHLGFGTPSVVLFELQMGVERLRTTDAVRSAQFELLIDRIVNGGDIVSFDAAAGREAARLMSGTSAHLRIDAMIAATAKVNGLALATRNTKDFLSFQVPLVNPFLYKG